MPSDNYNKIAEAIRSKQNVRATYKGHVRDLSPHRLGKKAGKERAFCFQFAGGSNEGLSEGGDWRCFTLEELSEVCFISGKWHSRSDYSPQTDRNLDVIDVEVSI